MKNNHDVCEQPDPTRQFPANPPQRILVVDDDHESRRLNAVVLSRCGYEVDVAEDGAAAWAALNGEGYDLMITDNTMPRLSGIELLKKLRSARLGLPVIMATGTLPTQEFALTPWLQPDATLLKPYTIEQLLGTVKMILHPMAKPAAVTLLTCASRRDFAAPAPVPVAAPPPGPTKAHDRILVVDEDSEQRVLYAGALDRLGYYVDMAHDGEAGWSALQTDGYKLLITENEMPNLTGVELVTKLRAAHMALPVVMAAGRLPTLERARGPSLQLAAMLSKPVALDELMAIVKMVLHPPANLPRVPLTPSLLQLT